MRALYFKKLNRAIQLRRSLLELLEQLEHVQPKVSEVTRKQLMPFIEVLYDGKSSLNRYNLLKIAVHRPSQTLVNGLSIAGKGTSYHAHALSSGIRAVFNSTNEAKKYDIETIFTSKVVELMNDVATLQSFSSGLVQNYGIHKHIVGDRPWSLFLAILTFSVGVLISPTVRNIVTVSPAVNPHTITKINYYIPPSNNVNEDKLVSAACGSSNVTNRADARRCMVENEIIDPCFLDLYLVDVTTCPIDPFTPKSNRTFRITAEAFGGVEKPLVSVDAVQTPWFVVTKSGSNCRYLSGTSIVAANQRFNYSCSHGGETYLTDLTKHDETSTFGCVASHATDKIQQCEVKELWY